MLKIAIIGGGAIGSLFAAKLSPLAEVWLFSQWQDHINVIQQRGLRLTELDGAKITVNVNATAALEQINRPVDVVIIAVKSHQTIIASRRAAALLGQTGIAISVQNGLGHLEQIGAILGKERVLQGVISHGATLLGPGHIRHAGTGPVYLATRPNIQAQLQHLQNLFNQVGFETNLATNLDTVLWGKLVINVGINALTAILRLPNGFITTLEPARQVMAAAVAEAIAIAQAKGIPLPYDDPQTEVKRVAQATATNRSSMLTDVLRGVPTEIEVINGAIVQIGAELGIPTPVNQTLLHLVKAFEASYQDHL